MASVISCFVSDFLTVSDKKQNHLAFINTVYSYNSIYIKKSLCIDCHPSVSRYKIILSRFSFYGIEKSAYLLENGAFPFNSSNNTIIVYAQELRNDLSDK